jgi:predicted AlkP superfamily pyrophosphatase or phosphodiesterase
MRKVVEKEKGPAYFYVYYGFLDAIEHEYGPHTEEYQAELSMLSFLFKKEFLDKLDRKTAKETFFIVTGDHGQVNVLPEETIYLNKYRSLVNMLQTDENKIIPPAGGPRDVFMHIKPEKLEEAFSFLTEKLEGKAEVVKISDALEKGMFGIGKPKKEFLERVGNLLVLPYKNYTVWWEYFKGKKFSLLGHHGGLSKSEMLVPFASAMLSEL